MEKNQFLIDMIHKQRRNLQFQYKLEFGDIKRIINNINNNPFNNNCCVWNGYITNGTKEKAKYVNFYFKHRKIALHRLLYINYVADINDTQYLKFTCQNKGTCCNINHIEKFNEYDVEIPILNSNLNSNSNPNKNASINIKEDKPAIRVIKIAGSTNPDGKPRFIIVLSD